VTQIASYMVSVCVDHWQIRWRLPFPTWLFRAGSITESCPGSYFARCAM